MNIVKSGNDSALFLKQEIFVKLSFLQSRTKNSLERILIPCNIH